MRCKLIRQLDAMNREQYPSGKIPRGTVIDHPDAWKFVRLGCAVPDDEECANKARMTPEDIERAAHAYTKADLGVIPEDSEAFDKGWMRGYNADGTWKPGPNYEEYLWDKTKKESPIIIVDEE